jgi:hypothetical protein
MIDYIIGLFESRFQYLRLLSRLGCKGRAHIKAEHKYIHYNNHPFEDYKHRE